MSYSGRIRMPYGVCQRGKRVAQICLVLASVFLPILLLAQSQPTGSSKSSPPGNKKLQGIISIVDDSTNHWLEEDVRWIITKEERAAFKTLTNDEARQQFIEQFWLRRDPTPDTIANEDEDEHYRRMVYANEQFASAVPGWKTDRGRIYIMYGPPDQIDSHPSGGSYQPTIEGAGSTEAFPFETWHYRYLEGIGQEIDVEFVDVCRCNDYRMTADSSQEYGLINVPQHHLSEQERTQKPEVQAYVVAQKPPQLQFKELGEILAVKMQMNQLPYSTHTDFLKITQNADWVRLTVELKNDLLKWVSKLGKSRIDVALLGRVTNLTGRIVSTFEDKISDSVADESLPIKKTGSQLYWRALALPPGRYRLDLAVKDLNSDAVGTYSTPLAFPRYSDGTLATSSLILADEMTAAKSVLGNFVIGGTRVRPRVEASKGERPTFDRSEVLNVWMQAYGLFPDEKSRPNATIEYELVNSCTGNLEMHLVEAAEHQPTLGQQMTLKKTFALARLEPGDYELRIRVSNQNGRQTAQSTAALTVR